ncbi:MAG: hypothetical protein J1F38_00660 [Muribaculaceae bacterium]|nr:hypothetical protein [Muribaculaceae bacterium]
MKWYGGKALKADIDNIVQTLQECKKDMELLNVAVAELKDAVAKLSHLRQNASADQIDRVFYKLDLILSKLEGNTSTNSQKGLAEPAPIHAGSASKPPVVEKFAQQIGDGEIQNSTLMDNESKYTKFILKISGNEASFELPQSEIAQEKILNSYSAIVPFVEEVVHVDAPRNILNVKPGRMELKNGVWTIAEKLQVKLQ